MRSNARLAGCFGHDLVRTALARGCWDVGTVYGGWRLCRKPGSADCPDHQPSRAAGLRGSDAPLAGHQSAIVEVLSTIIEMSQAALAAAEHEKQANARRAEMEAEAAPILRESWQLAQTASLQKQKEAVVKAENFEACTRLRDELPALTKQTKDIQHLQLEVAEKYTLLHQVQETNSKLLQAGRHTQSTTAESLRANLKDSWDALETEKANLQAETLRSEAKKQDSSHSRVQNTVSIDLRLVAQETRPRHQRKRPGSFSFRPNSPRREVAPNGLFDYQLIEGQFTPTSPPEDSRHADRSRGNDEDSSWISELATFRTQRASHCR